MKVAPNAKVFWKRLVEPLHCHMSAVEPKNVKGKAAEIILMTAGPCKAETKDILVEEDEPGSVGCHHHTNGKIAKSKGANCYELNLVAGYVTMCDTTEKEATSTKCVNTNYACNLYHLDDFHRHPPRNKHGSHSEDEVNTELYEHHHGVVLSLYLAERKKVYAVCATETAYVNTNNLLTATRLPGNEVGFGENPAVVHDVPK